MVEYKCDRCEKVYFNKYDFNRHIKRKNPCKISDIAEDNIRNVILPHEDHMDNTKKLPKEVDNIKEHMCNYCNKTFSRIDSLNRHLSKYCKVKEKDNDEKETIYQTLLNKFEKLENQNKEYQKQNIKLFEEVNKLKSDKQIINNNNTTNNTANIQLNQQNINIKVVAFRKEDLSYIKDEMYAKILNKGFKSVPSLVGYIHFDKNKPENNNVYISNMRDKHVLVYDGENWNLKEREEVLQQLVDDKTDILAEKFEELVNKIDEPTIKKFKRFLDQKDEDAVVASIKKDLKLLLYNSRKIPEKTRETLEFNAENIDK